jgi:monoamine oxidase
VSKPTALQIVGEQGHLSGKLNETLQANLKAAQTAAVSFAKELRQADKTSTNSDQRSLSSFLFNEKESPLFHNLSSEEEKKQIIEYARMMHIPYGTEVENISLDHLGYERNFAGTDGMPEGGMTRLINELAKEIQSNGGQIQLGRAVEKITSLGQGKGVQVEIKGSEESKQGEETTIQAKTAIVTIPLAVLQQSKTKGLFEPPLDSSVRNTIQKVTVGNLNKVLLTYKQPWWSLDAGTFVILPASKASEPTVGGDNDDLSALMDIFASTTLIVNSLCASNTGLPSSFTSPSLLVMIGGASGKKLESYSRLQSAEALDKYLSTRLSSPQRNERQLQHTFYSRWARQEFTGGATTTPVTVGNHPSDFATLAKPLWDNSLYFSGEHCEVNHRGSIAGSVISAQSTSEMILKHLATTSTSARH